MALKSRLTEMERTRIELPALTIDGQEVRTGWFEEAIAPHDHRRVLALALGIGWNTFRRPAPAAGADTEAVLADLDRWERDD